MLVIGAGIAGLTAAIHLADLGKSVIVINRSFDPGESNTKYAQGGISWWGDDDSPELLAHDIFEAGDSAGGKEAIRVLTEEGSDLVESFLIKRLALPFDRDGGGHIHRTNEAAHSRARIIHIEDQTGKAIQSGLLRAAGEHPKIRILSGTVAVDLISTTHHVERPEAKYGSTKILGAYVLDRASGKVKTIAAAYTILASGGVGALFQYSTNPEGARGDGIAMAERAGAHIINMEYLQFHPTALRKEGFPSFLISEAVRGEGGVLVNQSGERFVSELLPRDEVARATVQVMLRDKIQNVWLDCRSIAKKGIDLPKRFPAIFEQCRLAGLDIRETPIPVAPAAHYLCGGIRVDTWGRTNLLHLYAIGETACTGLHGANRLASTSLKEGLVWGKRSAENIAGTFEPENFDWWMIPGWDELNVTEQTDGVEISRNFTALRKTMWEHCGMIRSEAGLSRAWQDLWQMRGAVEARYRNSKLSDELIGLRNALQTAMLIVEQARRNRTSRGCHFREDQP